MDKAALRLELVRLAHRHDQMPEEILARAKKLEAYVAEGQAEGKGDSAEKAVLQTGRPPKSKSSGNPDSSI